MKGKNKRLACSKDWQGIKVNLDLIVSLLVQVDSCAIGCQTPNLLEDVHPSRSTFMRATGGSRQAEQELEHRKGGCPLSVSAYHVYLSNQTLNLGNSNAYRQKLVLWIYLDRKASTHNGSSSRLYGQHMILSPSRMCVYWGLVSMLFINMHCQAAV